MQTAGNDNPQPHRRDGGIRGRFVVLATLSLFIVVPVITYFVWSMTQATPPRTKLDYDHRANWFMMQVKPRPLKYSKFVAAETGKQYKKTDLVIDPDVERNLQRCAALAQGIDFLQDTQARDELLTLASDEQHGFYPPYLLATWYLANGQREAFEQWIRIAFSRAEGALAQRYTDSKGQPIAGHALAPVAIGYDRVSEGKLNATLVLIYPRPVTDDNGYAFLPTYRSVYRLTDPALPLGVDPGLHPTRLTFQPQPSNGTDPNWFAVPDGAVGRLEDAVVDKQ